MTTFLTVLLIVDIALTAGVGILKLVAPKTDTQADDEILAYLDEVLEYVKRLEGGLQDKSASEVVLPHAK